MASGKSSLGWALGILGLAIGLAGFIWLRISYLHSHGQNVFWLAELFSPVAVFTVLVVTFVEKLVGPGQMQPARRRKIVKKRLN